MTQKIFARQATGLVKQISTLEALGMTINQMGLLYVFNVVAFTPAFYPTANPLFGPFVGLLLVLPIIGIYILFSIGIARTGGDYVWVSRTFHPSVGFFTNFAFTLIVLSVVGSVAPWIGQWSIGEMFYDLGVLNKNTSFLNIASAMQSPTNAFIVSAIFIIIAGIVVIASTKLAARIVKYWTFIALLIGAIFVVTVLASGGSSTFANNFNSLSGSNMTYSQVASTGQTQLGTFNGVPPAFSSATLYASALGLLGFLGFNSSAYFSGEVKQNRRSQIVAQLGGSIIYAVFVTIMVAVEYFGEGPAFVNAMAGMWVSGFGNYPFLAGTPPLASGLSIFWTQNQGLVSLFNIGFGATAEMMNISIFFMLSRNLFAWSFDRVVPTAFADINPKTGTPIKSVSVMVVVGLIYCYIFIFATGILSGLFTYGTAGEFTAFLIVSLAAIVYPFRRKDIFQSSESIARYKVGGIPLISIFGVMGFIISIVTIYAVLLPAIGGSDFLSVFFYGIGLTFLIGAIVFVIAYVIRKSQGIDLGLLQKEIPPE
ncbi:MAG TPA: amino acid permease [Nitrososphaerales archaeon]|nr:amino acid permease [Nitrososphaerales archaeon]